MAIQMRRGNNAYYDESKMKPGEVAVATDTRQAYVGMGNGNAEELAFKKDLEGLGSGGSGGTTDHAQLTNRDAADQHPIEAIRGLRAELDEQRIIATATGESIVLTDSSDKPLEGLVLYGKTTQNGIPSPTNPIPLVSAGEGGNITVSISDGTNGNNQTLAIQTPNGLPGIAVASGGNYTDADSQQWVCDEINFERGTYAKRFINITIDGNGEWAYEQTTSGTRFRYESQLLLDANAPSNARKTVGISTHFSAGSANETYLGVVNSFAIGANRRLYVTCECSSVSQLKNILSANPMTIVYELETPVETPLTAEEIAAYKALHTNKPVTTVLNDGGAGMEVTYIPDNRTANYIDDLIKNGTGGTTNHAQLTNRDAADQHPISAITGLQEALDDKSALPAVTATDNGKFLRVVNGTWAATAIPNAEGLDFTLLWENASPASEFEEQTLSYPNQLAHPPGEFEWLCFDFAGTNTEFGQKQRMISFSAGYEFARLWFGSYNEQGALIIVRDMTGTENSLTFALARPSNITTGIAGSLIPRKIYGVKGVTSS